MGNGFVRIVVVAVIACCCSCSFYIKQETCPLICAN